MMQLESISFEGIIPIILSIQAHARQLFEELPDANIALDGSNHSGVVVLSTLIVNLAALIGVILLVPSVIQRFRNCKRSDSNITSGISSRDYGKNGNFLSFGVGALMATSMVIIVPESPRIIASSELIGEKYDHRFRKELNPKIDDGTDVYSVATTFGCAVLGGYLLPMLLRSFTPIAEDKTYTPFQVNTDNVGKTSFGEDNNLKVIKTNRKKFEKIAVSICIGYALHNFCEGMFMGTAFLICSRMIAFSIWAVLLSHELAQELVDLLFLMKNVGLRSISSLITNFVFGLLLTLGAIAFLATSDVKQTAIGVMLSFASGLYVHFAMSFSSLYSSISSSFWSGMFELDFF